MGFRPRSARTCTRSLVLLVTTKGVRLNRLVERLSVAGEAMLQGLSAGSFDNRVIVLLPLSGVKGPEHRFRQRIAISIVRSSRRFMSRDAES
jgi:hypothetical protein